MYGKFGLVPITAYTCITYFTGWQKKKYYKKEKKKNAIHTLKLTYDQKLETFLFGPYTSPILWPFPPRLCSGSTDPHSSLAHLMQRAWTTYMYFTTWHEAVVKTTLSLTTSLSSGRTLRHVLDRGWGGGNGCGEQIICGKGFSPTRLQEITDKCCSFKLGDFAYLNNVLYNVVQYLMYKYMHLECTVCRDANIYDLGVIYTIYSPRLRLYDAHMIFYDFPRFYVNKIKCVQFVLHVHVPVVSWLLFLRSAY